MKNKLFGHLKTVLTHKKYVAKFCFMCGLYKQGLLHDMSKFSPTEFIESVKYWSGTRSPIDLCKEENGISYAWLHHRSNNKHHWEFWCDNFESGIMGHKMPYKYALEMVCDWLGAGVAYSGGIDNFSMQDEYAWWVNKRKVVKMHEDTKHLVDRIFVAIIVYGDHDGNYQDIKNVLGNKTYMKDIKYEYMHNPEKLVQNYRFLALSL